MLWLRVLTALVAAPLVLAAVLWLETLFAPLFLLLAALGLNEWLQLSGAARWPLRLGLLGLYILAGLALLTQPQLTLALLAAGAAFWLIAIATVLAYPRGRHWLHHGVASTAAGMLVFTSGWLGLVSVHGAPGGPWLVVWLLLLVWAADIGAYGVGRLFGRRKLAASISPGKTREGALGGLLVALVVTVPLPVVLTPLADLGLALPYWAAMAAGLVVVSIFGDLFESVLKREHGVKDSGTLFPGHGGVLDRIDALLAVLPGYALLLMVLCLLP